MKLDILDKIALIFFSLWIVFTTFNAYAGEWNDKPVICEQEEEALKVLQEKGQVLVITGVQHTKVRSEAGLAQYPVNLPFRIYVNPVTKTYSVVEIHPTYNSVCILAFGSEFFSIITE